MHMSKIAFINAFSCDESALTPGRVPTLCSGFILKKNEKLHIKMSVKSQ